MPRWGVQRIQCHHMQGMPTWSHVPFKEYGAGTMSVGLSGAYCRFDVMYSVLCGVRVPFGSSARERMHIWNIQHWRADFVHFVPGAFHFPHLIVSRLLTLSRLAGWFALSRHYCCNSYGLWSREIFSWQSGQLHVMPRGLPLLESQ